MTLTKKYYDLAPAHLNDSLFIFKWGYTAWKAALRQQDTMEIYKRLAEVNGVMALAPSPHAYDFARTHLFIARQTELDSSLRDISEELLRRDPHDSDVKYNLAVILLNTFSPPKHAEALQLAHELMKERPKWANSFALVGESYWLTWLRTNDPEDARKAIEGYRHYLKLAPADAHYRAGAQHMIDMIQNPASPFH